MLALISPAKKLDFESEWMGDSDSCTQPDLLDHSQILADALKHIPLSQLQSMMKLSDKLGALNHARYQRYSVPFTTVNARPAIYAFRGDTYVGFDVDSLSPKDIGYAQSHVRILSGLYGMLRPLDLMQAYRLEMGAKLATPRGEDLYDFWGNILTEACNEELKSHKDNTVVSLASNEYIKAIDHKKLNGKFITCHFKEIKDGAPKIISLFAKRARGAMARYMIQNRIETPENLKNFDIDGYRFFEDLSSDKDYVFLRERA